MMVGYALNHNGDCYRMWNPKTNYIYESINFIWLKIKYFTKKSVTIEQSKVPRVSLIVYREPDTDIIGVREGNDYGYSADISDEKSYYNDDTNETYDASYVTKTSSVRVV